MSINHFELRKAEFPPLYWHSPNWRAERMTMAQQENLAYGRLAAIAMACLVLSGCGNDDGSYKPPPLPTADALVDHFNALTTKAPVDVVALHALYVPESDLHRDLIELDRKMTVMFDL